MSITLFELFFALYLYQSEAFEIIFFDLSFVFIKLKLEEFWEIEKPPLLLTDDFYH